MLDEKLRCMCVLYRSQMAFHSIRIVFFSFLLCCLHFERDFKNMLTILRRSLSLTKSCLKSTFAFITNSFYLKWANQHTFNTVSIRRSLRPSIIIQWCVSPWIATQKIFSMHMKSVSIKILSRYWMLFIILIIIIIIMNSEFSTYSIVMCMSVFSLKASTPLPFCHWACVG